MSQTSIDYAVVADVRRQLEHMSADLRTSSAETACLNTSAGGADCEPLLSGAFEDWSTHLDRAARAVSAVEQALQDQARALKQLDHSG